jgi:hypothetical protein
MVWNNRALRDVAMGRTPCHETSEEGCQPAVLLIGQVDVAVFEVCGSAA